ncbi:MAG: polysaccharide biosynthesis/export family protein [Methylocystis sp.]|uniref:polysaccharide biosynthesis/export family protein n=1 Tax=Methylocystis sp. TaxID=1911079 RepID=UPI003DA5D25E
MAALILGVALCAGCNEYSPSGIDSAPQRAIHAEGTKLDELARASAPYIAESTPGASAYKIGPLDVLEISVFKVPELTQSVQVADNGLINLPLVGDIQASGKTPSTLETELRGKLNGTYIKNPSVRVFVKEFNSARITLDGEVKSPGVYALRGSPTLLAAISLAGGRDKDTASSEVIIFRANPDGTRSAARVDLAAIRSGAVVDPIVQAGDVIVVEGSTSKYVYNTLKMIVPFTSLGTLAFMAT